MAMRSVHFNGSGFSTRPGQEEKYPRLFSCNISFSEAQLMAAEPSGRDMLIACLTEILEQFAWLGWCG